MGLGPQALQEIARVNHPIRSPSAFRSFLFAQIERERGRERERERERKRLLPRGLREPRFTGRPYPFLLCFYPFSSACSYFFFLRPFAILVCFLFSSLSFFSFFASCFFCFLFVSASLSPISVSSPPRIFFLFRAVFLTSNHFVFFFLLSFIFPNIGGRYRTISLYIYGVTENRKCSRILAAT